LKNINIRRGSFRGIRRSDMQRSKQMYFTGQRKLFELEGNLTEEPRTLKPTIKKREFNIKKLVKFALIFAILLPLAWGGYVSTKSTDSSSYVRSK